MRLCFEQRWVLYIPDAYPVIQHAVSRALGNFDLSDAAVDLPRGPHDGMSIRLTSTPRAIPPDSECTTRLTHHDQAIADELATKLGAVVGLRYELQVGAGDYVCDTLTYEAFRARPRRYFRQATGPA